MERGFHLECFWADGIIPKTIVALCFALHVLSKWLFKLLNEDGAWQELLHNKYLKQKTLSEVQAKPTDSPFWKGLMGVKDDFFTGVFLKLVME
jgi:hypothetical protein